MIAAFLLTVLQAKKFNLHFICSILIRKEKFQRLVLKSTQYLFQYTNLLVSKHLLYNQETLAGRIW